MNDRPEWASGPDWEGWRVCDVPIIGAYTGYMARNFKSGGGARIYRRRHEPSGGLWVRDIDGEVATLRCVSPAHALTAANALADAAGGWE